jgi:CheY-like chemotaxis protein
LIIAGPLVSHPFTAKKRNGPLEQLMPILVAEDETALASFVKKGLESEHFAVDVSADGEQARALAGELDFDSVVLDLNLQVSGRRFDD